jgi:seryl-tRNA synthetase
MNFKVNNGVYHLDFELSKLEKKLFDDFSNMLEEKGFQYLSVPSIIEFDTFNRQEVKVDTLSADDEHCLSGSAEQGILEYFKDSEVEPLLIYANNTCFRKEEEYDGLVRLMEFKKLEQYCFCHEADVKENFELLLFNAIDFLKKYEIKHRIVDVTKKDPGYHVKKYDIEILTRRYGYVESHSCSYFGEEQTKRFNITGATHTISNTGIASPRILLPFIEEGERRFK